MTITALQDKFTDIRKRLFDIQIYINNARAEFEAIIKDQTYPLADRWNLFRDAPEGFRGTESSIWQPKALAQFGSGGHEWDQLLWTDRYRTINLVDMIDEAIDLEDIDKTREYFDDDASIQVEDYIALVEEMLACNVGSFVYDW